MMQQDNTTQTLFIMHIMDGYSFRHTIGLMKSETDYATMVLSEKLIEISFINTSKCAVHGIRLLPQEFTVYQYNIRDENGQLVNEYPITFDTTEMFNTTKGIGRRDGVRLYWLAGDNKINVQPIKQSTKEPGRSGALFVKILTMEHMRYGTGAHNAEPNVRVQAKDFAALCSQANTLKCATLEIAGFNRAVTLTGVRANQTTASFDRISSQTDVPRTQAASACNIDEIYNLIDNLNISDAPPSSSGLSLNIVNRGDLMTVKVPISTVKALSKIHNISPSGTLLRFYFSVGKPIKIESPIGTYGTYTICLR